MSTPVVIIIVIVAFLTGVAVGFIFKGDYGPLD